MIISANFATKNLYCLLIPPFTSVTNFDELGQILKFKLLISQRLFSFKEVESKEQGQDQSFFLAIKCYIKFPQPITPLLLRHQLMLMILIVITVQEQMSDVCKLVNQSCQVIRPRKTFEKMADISFCESMGES